MPKQKKEVELAQTKKEKTELAIIEWNPNKKVEMGQRDKNNLTNPFESITLLTQQQTSEVL